MSAMRCLSTCSSQSVPKGQHVTVLVASAVPSYVFWSLYVTGWKNPFPDFSHLVSSVYRQLELPTSRKLSGRKSHFPESCVSGEMSNCRALSHREGGSSGKGSTGTAEPKKVEEVQQQRLSASSPRYRSDPAPCGQAGAELLIFSL